MERYSDFKPDRTCANAPLCEKIGGCAQMLSTMTALQEFQDPFGDKGAQREELQRMINAPRYSCALAKTYRTYVQHCLDQNP